MRCGVVFVVGLYNWLEEVKKWGGRHGREDCVVVLGDRGSQFIR